MEYKYIAHHSVNNETSEFNTLEEALSWLKDIHQDEGTDEGFSDETITGEDYIAKVTHRSKYVIDARKASYIAQDAEEGWPYGDKETVGHIEMEEVR